MEQQIVSFLIKEKIIKKDEEELYIYGLNKLKGSIINFLMTVLVGLILHMFWESILFFILYVPIRQYAGGYHAPNQRICFILSVMLILAALLAIKYIGMNSLCIVSIAAISGIIIFIKAPVESINKPLSIKERDVFRKRTRLILLIYIAVILSCIIFSWDYIAKCILIVVASSALLTLFSDKMNTKAKKI